MADTEPVLRERGDAQLIEKAKAGDADAFGELYERYAQVVFRFFSAHLDNWQDAEDLTEATFLRFWRSLANFQEKGVPFQAFLFRIARNGLIDHYRQIGRSGRSIPLDEGIPVRDQRPEPSETVANNLEYQEVREVLADLREDYRTVLVLRFMSELSPEETGLVMGKTPGAVRVLQHRALAALRNLLKES